jgi:ribonuclease HI
VVESGPLPGLLQSAVRAEVYAAMRAIEFAIQHAQAVTVCTDSDAVVRRLRKLLAGCQVSNGCSHADLWTRIALQVQGFPGEISVAKVAAHCSVQSALTPVEEWSIRHNAMADREAVNANLRRPPEFWTLFQQHTDALEYVESINAAIHTVLLQISQEVVRAQTTAEMPNELDRPSTLTLQLPVWKGLLPFSVPRGASRWYGEDMVRLVLSWFWGVLFTSDAPMAWVSHPQLYADFM